MEEPGNPSSFLPAVPPSTTLPTGLPESRDPEKARQYLMDLSVHYERYLNKILSGLYKWNHLRSEIDEIIGNVKDHLFWPSDERLKSDSFWLWRYLPGEGAKLRTYLVTCAKNYARDKLRNKHPLRIDPLAIETHASTPAPADCNLIDNARHIKMVLTEHAKVKYRNECGADSPKWRAFSMRALESERVPTFEVSARLGISEYQVANYVHQARQRMMEHIWLSLFDLEKTDILSDTIVAIDMAVLSAISAQSTGDFQQATPDAEQAALDSARESAAAIAADNDMLEMFGFLPKCRKDKRTPSRGD